jgi:hypothetical protein
MPSVSGFKQSVIEFKQRVLESNVKSIKDPLQDQEPIRVKVGPDQLLLGVRREQSDIAGSKFVSSGRHSGPGFWEGTKEGLVVNPNKAAGVERQLGVHKNALIFDKKAVIKSLK